VADERSAAQEPTNPDTDTVIVRSEADLPASSSASSSTAAVVAASAQAAPAEGRVLADRYVLDSELGRGGMGIVWRGRDLVIGRAVAIKEVRLGTDVPAADHATCQARILREARTAGRLNDPAVVTVFDVVQELDSVYIVMELVEAPTLSAVVRREGALPAPAVAAVGRQVLCALAAAHAAGIVHRDVKPSNIMLAGDGRAKLTDFGIARAVDDPTLTGTGMMLGSPAYLAPERLAGSEATSASDLWSLGAVLFYAVEGRAAFERETTAATLSAIIHDVPFLTRCQGPLAAAISGMLIVNPAGRLTVAQIRSLLDAATRQPADPAPGQDVTATTGMPTQQTALMGQSEPSGTLLLRESEAGRPGPVDSGAVTPGRRRRPLRRIVTISAVVLLVAASAAAGWFTGYRQGQSRPADGADAVQVLTRGGPGADLPDLDLNGCASGPTPLKAGTATYTQVGCDMPHDLEVYYSQAVVNSSYSRFGPGGNGPIPYPDPAVLATSAQRLCFLSRQLSATADPKGSTYRYTALIPSKNLWNGTHLPANWQSDQAVYCLMWNMTGQLPGEPGS
jgi:hypothetical protein